MASKKAPIEKRVVDLRAERADDGTWRLLAISADATLADLHLAILGAFEFHGSYDDAELVYRFTIDGKIYENGRGSRTPLRKLLSTGCAFAHTAPTGGIATACEVTASYEVSSRRHYPKVLEGDEACAPRHGTWDAQSAMRREFSQAHASPARAIDCESPKIQLNAPCSCGSGRKYKRCCGSPLRAV